MQVFSTRTISLEISRAWVVQRSFVGRSKVCRAPEEPRDVLGEYVQHLARCFAPRDPLRIGRKYRKVAVPPSRELASLHQFDFGRELWIFTAIRGEELRPFSPRLRAMFADPSREVLIGAGGD